MPTMPTKAVVRKALEQATFDALQRTGRMELIYVTMDILRAAQAYGLVKQGNYGQYYYFRNSIVKQRPQTFVPIDLRDVRDDDVWWRAAA